jgi:zeta-carotene desaturase
MLPGAFTHWVFGRGWRGADGWSRLSAVVSAAPDRAQITREVLEATVLEDIRKHLPEARNAKVENVKSIRTMRATVLLTPGTEALRPTARTPIKGLFMAGDYTATGLPATIESAARSGILAAEAAINIYL